MNKSQNREKRKKVKSEKTFLYESMLKRGNQDWGNQKWSTRSLIEINEKLKPILNRKVDDLTLWVQKLINFQIEDKDVRRRYSSTCFSCQRRAKAKFENTF